MFGILDGNPALLAMALILAAAFGRMVRLLGE